LKGEGKKWFLDKIDYTVNEYKHLFKEQELRNHINAIIEGKAKFTFMPWRVAALGIWHKMQ
ncbi:MAG: hypothetical protein EBZ77_11435, partial [Chitinophagia bacterium]|nr:hypothetical protein [Chitinophagia bacterium]